MQGMRVKLRTARGGRTERSEALEPRGVGVMDASSERGGAGFAALSASSPPMVLPIRRELTGAPESRRLFCGRDGRAPRSSLGGFMPDARDPQAFGCFASSGPHNPGNCHNRSGAHHAGNWRDVAMGGFGTNAAWTVMPCAFSAGAFLSSTRMRCRAASRSRHSIGLQSVSGCYSQEADGMEMQDIPDRGKVEL